MKEFSNIEYSFEDFIKEYEKDKEIASLKSNYPFPKSEMTEGKKEERIKNSIKDFWFFDKIYFSKNIYENYAKPNRMLNDIVKASLKPGYHLFLGPRKHGKTITAKKLILWLTLTNKIKIAGVYSETINKSSAILKDLYKICINNDRLLYDFNIIFQEANSDSLAFTSNLSTDINIKFVASFSEGRSVRGYTRIFGRPTFLIADDIETKDSSFSQQAVQNRIDKLTESFHSMNDNSTFLILANDFNNSSAIHRLRIDYEQNLLPDNFYVYIYKAFQNNKPLWHQRYKVKTENELKQIINPLSESEWQADFMQNPIPPEGFFFVRQYYSEYVSLPNDTKAILYCDPNLSKKGKGDTTAITVLGYSPNTDKYYLIDAVCKSFNDSNLLLNKIFNLKNNNKRIYAIAFDGNVTQESTWTQFVRNWCLINKIPFPIIDYKHYNVNDLAKNVQLVYNSSKLLFPKNFSKSEDGQNYLNQLFSFTGEKKNKLDDAPDSLICAFEFLHERKLTRQNIQPVKVFNDYYF